MIHRVVVSPEARADLLRLNRFLAEANPGAARGAMDVIDAGLRSLTRRPHRRAADKDGLRTLNIRFGRAGYVTWYRVDGDVVVIARVFHMREHRP
jgi:plasmid stabilization system protein ParE